MKMKLLLTALIFPFITQAQNPDTVGVARQVDSLNMVSFNLMYQHKNTEAIAVSETAEQLAIEKVGKESAEYARARFYHAVVLSNMNKRVEAEEWLLEIKHLQERVIGGEHPDYATTLYQLGTNYYYRGKLPEALASMSAAHGIRDKVLGKDHQRYGESLYFLAFLLRKTGDPEGAEPLLLEYVAFNEKKHGKGHFEYARSLSDLANLYQDKAEFRKAAEYHVEALSIMEKTVGKFDATYALTMNYLGVIYLHQGEFEKSELLLLEALNIQKKANARVRQQAITLDNLGILYSNLGNYDKAEVYVLEALTLFEQKIGTENPNYLNSLRTLAEIYLRKGDLKNSEQYYLQTAERIIKQDGKEHANYGKLLGNISLVYLAMNDYPRAEAVLMESKGIFERLSVQESPDYAFTLLTMGKLYIELGKYELAEPLLQNGKTIAEEILGKESFYAVEALNALATLHWKQKRLVSARAHLIEAIECQRNTLLKGTQHLSERELTAYARSFEVSMSREFSFAQTQPEVTGACFDNILFQKGFLLHTVSRIYKLAGSNPGSAEKVESLQALRHRLSTEYTKPIGERDSIGIAKLEDKANTLEKDLARTVTGYGEAIRQVRWQEVQAALKPDEAALEFVHYRYKKPEETDSVMYAAIILKKGDLVPLFVPLFEEKRLLPLLHGAAGGSNFLKINALYAAKPAGKSAKTLYELVWEPLDASLSGCKTIYCSPAGLLNRVNITAIANPQGKTIGDTRQIVSLGSTRQLVVPDNSPSNTSTTEAYLAGGIRYDTDSTAVAYALRDVGTRGLQISTTINFQPDSSVSRAGDLGYLPATAVEVHEIGKMLKNSSFATKVDTGFNATEEAFRQLGRLSPSPKIIHLATHGYFFPDPVGKPQSTKRNFGQESVFKMSDHPMIRSGLIMAGAKQAWLTGKHPKGQEDGILTAYEISQMNLSNTELVVLSACETGLGEIAGAEGVYGLQRAFKIAGAKYLIMSLWKVDDQSTKAFMTEFYRQWLQGDLSIPQAFRATQQAMRAKSPSPYDWAGFILIE